MGKHVVNKSSDEFVVVGKIGAPYGIKGWVKIHSFTEWTTDIFDYVPWYLEEAGYWKAFEIVNGKEHGKALIVKLAGFDTPEQVRVLTGKKIAINRTQLPPLKKNEYYWRDLIGLTVINQHGAVLGTISHLLETGSNDVLVVKNDKEHAIPYLPGSVVVSVDLVNREMRVIWELI
jgi:16S rRNA processing protein RimM